MGVGPCVVCLAAEHSTDESLARLVRWQAVKLDQARAALLPVQVDNGRLRDRIRELEEIVDRLNRKVAAGNRRPA